MTKTGCGILVVCVFLASPGQKAEGEEVERAGEEGTPVMDDDVACGYDYINARYEADRVRRDSDEGPRGYQAGRIWGGGTYEDVGLELGVPYAAPFGFWKGWSIVAQPDHIHCPAYATYPVETAVQVALRNLGIYEGGIDWRAESVAGAVEQYREGRGERGGGGITPALLSALGIQASP